MTSYLEYLKSHSKKLSLLQDEASAAFDNRPLPKHWKKGQKVRYLRDSEWAWTAGSVAYVVDFRDDPRHQPAHEYQVFYTSGTKDGKFGTYWTTPDDVELVEDVK